ncbi:MAG: LamG domain-containing protein [Planctomycetota bacterium]|jgi:hypothetical protein
MCRKLIVWVIVVLVMGLLGPGSGDAAGADPGLTVWYKLDESAGLNANDSSMYNRDGTLYQWPEDAGFTPGWVPDGGQFGGCLVFYDDTHIIIPKTALSTVTNGITVSLWLKDAWRLGFNYVFDAGTSQEETEGFRVMALIGTAPDAQVLWRAGNDSNDTLRWDLDGGNVQDLEGWHQWTFVKDEVAGNIRIYFDGSLAESDDAVDNTLSTVLPTKLADTDFDFRIGSRNKQMNDLEGTVDEFVVYDRALSDAEVERLYYTGGDMDREIAWKPSPAHRGQNLCPDVSLSWSPGDSAFMHDIYFGTDRDNVENATAISAEYRTTQGPNSYDAGALETLNPGVTYYWRIDEISGVITKGDVWEFTINDGNAFDPDPEDGETWVLKESLLSWSAGCSAVSHRVYFSADLSDVESRDPAAYLGETGSTSIDPCAGDLEYLTDYYWVVDEVNGVTTWSGQVWSFQTENAVTDPNFLLWYRLDESEGYEASDSSDYLRHAYVRMRDFLIDGTVPPWTPDEGRWGGSLGFDDDTAIWVPPTTLNKLSDAVTIVTWIQDGSNWALQANGGDSQLTVKFESGVTWRAGNDTNDVLTMDGSPSGWNHYAFVKDETKGNIQIYFNGELAESDDVVDNTLIGIRSKPFKIGGRTGGPMDFIGARMDEFMVYDRALTAAEVFRQYYSGGPVGALGQAWMPYPSDGATEVAREVVLGWKPGDYTVTRDVYLGTAWADVNDADTTTVGIFRGNQEANEYDPPGELEFDTVYYWRVDEINEPNIWKGRVWSFRSANFLVVDDMESYSAIPSSGEEIYDTWDDGFVNWTGSQLALEYGVDAIVRSGGQSMKLGYNNSVAYYKYSEIDANSAGGQPGNLAIGKDWTSLDVKSFTLFFYGQASNDSTEQLYAALEDTPGHIVVVDYGVYGEDLSDIAEEEWHEFNIDLEDVNQAGVDIKDVNKVRIGFGDRDNPTVGGSGLVFFDDIRLYRLRCAPWIVKPVADLSDNCIVDWADVMMMAEHWLRTDFVLDTINPGTTGLVGHWTLDGDAMDSSSYANHGTVTGDYTWVADHNDGLALALTEGICKVPDAEHLRPPAQVSASAWINYSVDQGASPRIVVKGADNHEAYCIELSGNDSLRFYVRDTSGTSYNADSPDDVFDLGEWVHAAGTYDGSLVKCYVNGQVVGDNYEAVAIALSQDTNDLGIGNRPDGEERQFRGSVDEVRVYSRALSAAEVAWLATDGTGYVELTSPANLYDKEATGQRAVNFRDYAVLMDTWLEEELWPAN